MNKFVRSPAGLCLTSRSRPMAPPRNAASTRRVAVCVKKALSAKPCCRSSCMRVAGFYTLNGLFLDPVDGRGRLAFAVEHGDGSELSFVRGGCLGNRVALEGDDVIGILAWIFQGALPQSV